MPGHTLLVVGEEGSLPLSQSPPSPVFFFLLDLAEFKMLLPSSKPQAEIEKGRGSAPLFAFWLLSKANKTDAGEGGWNLQLRA